MLSFVYRESIILHSTTVEIDDKNNCKTSGSKYIQNTSEQDLNSSYWETQDSKTEDTPSTNVSADEQNLSPNFWNSKSMKDQEKKIKSMFYYTVIK